MTRGGFSLEAPPLFCYATATIAEKCRIVATMKSYAQVFPTESRQRAAAVIEVSHKRRRCVAQRR